MKWSNELLVDLTEKAEKLTKEYNRSIDENVRTEIFKRVGELWRLLSFLNAENKNKS